MKKIEDPLQNRFGTLSQKTGLNPHKSPINYLCNMELISIHDFDHFSNFPLSYGGPTGGKQVAQWAKNEIFSSSFAF